MDSGSNAFGIGKEADRRLAKFTGRGRRQSFEGGQDRRPHYSGKIRAKVQESI